MSSHVWENSIKERNREDSVYIYICFDRIIEYPELEAAHKDFRGTFKQMKEDLFYFFGSSLMN